jgi:hypothetical protein
MFRISVVDHIRLNFDRTRQNYTLHAKAAERLAVTTARIRIGVLILLAIAAVTAATSLVEGRSFQIAAAITAGLAFAAHAAYLAIGVEGRVHAHRACAQRLWQVSDRYQSLLSEIEDGMLDRASILQRRDDLSAQEHAAYEQPFALDQKAHESARQAASAESQPAAVSAEAPAPAPVLPAPMPPDSDAVAQNRPPH